MKNLQDKKDNNERLEINKQQKKKDSRLFSPFMTERMEDYAALSIAALIIITVLVIYQ